AARRICMIPRRARRLGRSLVLPVPVRRMWKRVSRVIGMGMQILRRCRRCCRGGRGRD
ncbi:hypothetical protein FQN53_006202, partial [Emmonsiellopsis sp. PD_33]